MRTIPTSLRKKLASDPYYQKCARACSECDGRITFEHAIVFAGRQLNELWAIIPLCEYHHAVNKHQDGGDLDKEMNISIALNRATDDELIKVSKGINYISLRDRLKNLFKTHAKPVESEGIKF